MANVLKHRFVSAKTDGADASQIQPSNWNDGHAFSGGAAGDVLTRDPTDAAFGAIWKTLGVWTPYTPVWSTNGTQPAIGNGVLKGRFTTIGKTCHCTISVTIGTTTLQGSGAWFFLIPTAVQQDGQNTISGIALAQKGTGNGIVHVGAVRFSGQNVFFQMTGFQGGGVLAPGVPFAWEAADTLDASFTFTIL